MIDRLHWLGHDSFYVQGSKVVYFDPWDVPESAPPADIILISHAHHDHCSPQDVERLSKPETVIVADYESAAQVSGEVRVVAPGDVLEVEGVIIRAVPAYNLDKPFHPKDAGWLGFVVEIDGVSIYHTGDSDHIPEMKGLSPDIALIPVSGTYVMDADQAINAARDINPKIAVPMHYGKIVGDENDAKRFAQTLKDEIKVVVKTKE
jgi:L-ascorbate metabolism protein UlaG (beta-lactamase superfamily)